MKTLLITAGVLAGAGIVAIVLVKTGAVKALALNLPRVGS